MVKRYFKKKKNLFKKRRGYRRVAKHETGLRRKTRLRKTIEKTVKNMAEIKDKYVRSTE